MKKPSAPTPSNDWRIFLGDGQPKTGWTIPEPPPWRQPHAGRDEASPSPPPPLSRAVSENAPKYQSTLDTVRMVNAAIYLRRPLLVTGGPGTGKSTLVDAIAHELDLGEPLRWSVTSRSTLRDALYSYDAIGRVQYRDQQDQADSKLDIGDFIELGALGTAMLPRTRPRVLLIDEIDKADIDLPNDLLNVLDEGRYQIPELSRLGKIAVKVRTLGGSDVVEISKGQVACYEYPLVVLTSNGERDFPPAFLRRCLQLKMPDPCSDPARLNAIVSAHFGPNKLNASATLIAKFVASAEGGQILATDQLLNAIQIVTGAYSMDEKEREIMKASLTAGLGRRLT